jgi:hypothetical protein
MLHRGATSRPAVAAIAPAGFGLGAAIVVGTSQQYRPGVLAGALIAPTTRFRGTDRPARPGGATRSSGES